MTSDVPFAEFCPLGVDGILVRFGRVLTEDANARALAFRDAVAAANLPGATEIASSLTSVRVAFDPLQTNRAVMSKALADVAQNLSTKPTAPKRQWSIPVAFGTRHAPQLAEAAAISGRSQQDAIRDITTHMTRVIAIGFAPGQPYLGMLPAHWDIPRQSHLTESLPRGALVAAVRQLIIWAADAPTGWRDIGQTAFKVYRPDTPEPFAFAPGDAVGFDLVSDDQMDRLLAQSDPNGGATCKVLS